VKHFFAVTFFAVLGTCAAIFSSAPVLAAADIPILTVQDKFTAPGDYAITKMSGQQTCGYTLTGTGTGLFTTLQLSPDNQISWQVATNVTTNGYGNGIWGPNNIVQYGQTYFKLHVTAISGGVENYIIVCSSANVGALPPYGMYYDTQAAMLNSNFGMSMFNATSSEVDRVHGDPIFEMLVNSDCSLNKVITGPVTNTVVKASAGRICSVMVTTVTSGAITFYDNATTNSGNVLDVIPSATAVTGASLQARMPAVNGITVNGPATSGSITISYQ
jgi:hypothetical protein